MTTPLEQIKEKLEKMRRTNDSLESDGRCRNCGYHVSAHLERDGSCFIYNQCLDEMIELLPSIIQEVVEECIKIVEDGDEGGTWGKTRLEKLIYLKASLKETNK